MIFAQWCVDVDNATIFSWAFMQPIHLICVMFTVKGDDEEEMHVDQAASRTDSFASHSSTSLRPVEILSAEPGKDLRVELQLTES